MVSAIFIIGIAVAAFVGVNIGGSSTGVAFGPATGSGVLSKRKAAFLMMVFVLLGGLTIGTNVVNTLGKEFIPPESFTLGASIGVLLFTGLGILLGNVLKISVSTSETAVGAVVGMGAALGVLEWRTVGIVVVWWIVSAIFSFWIAAAIGRYAYEHVIESLDLDNRGRLGEIVVIGIGCYMAFSAGASNVANAVAPLVGSGNLGTLDGIVLGGLTIGAGAFLLGPRTMETVGEDITELSKEAALVVELISASVITLLSFLGIPASLAITATMCVIGLGWGRASQKMELRAALSADSSSENWGEDTLNLYNPQLTRRIIITWITTPVLASILAFVSFWIVGYFGLI